MRMIGECVKWSSGLVAFLEDMTWKLHKNDNVIIIIIVIIDVQNNHHCHFYYNKY